MSYRNLARTHFNLAEKQLDAGEDQRLKYVALELRMAMEALTYDRALAYKDEFPPQEYETWQPRKVLSVLLEIDSTADKGSSISFGLETRYGEPPEHMTHLGSEEVLGMGILKKHYDALGSYLHIQSMKQLRTQKTVDYSRMRSRCQEIVIFIGRVLASPVFNVTLGRFARIDCEQCSKPIRKRFQQRQNEVEAECYECCASYTIVDCGDGQFEWKPQQQEIQCAGEGCEQTIAVWRRELEVGRNWACSACGGKNTFAIGIQYERP